MYIFTEMPPVAISLKLSRKAFRTKQLFNAFQLFLCIYNIRIYLSEYDCQLPRFWVARLTFDTLPLPLNALPRLRALHYLRLTLSWLPPTRIHIQRITISLPPLPAKLSIVVLLRQLVVVVRVRLSRASAYSQTASLRPQPDALHQFDLVSAD